MKKYRTSGLFNSQGELIIPYVDSEEIIRELREQAPQTEVMLDRLEEAQIVTKKTLELEFTF